MTSLHKISGSIAVLLSLCSAAVQADCLGMKVHARRGAGEAPQHALSALRNAYFGTWDGVEAPLRQLGDGNWVVHADAQTGRVVDSGAVHALRQLDADAWRAASMKLHASTTAETPPFVSDIADLASAFPHKTLNGEIQEAAATCAPVAALVTQLRAGIKHGNWFLTSSAAGNLACARAADPHGYLGLVVLAARPVPPADARPVSRLGARHARPPRLDKAWLQRLQAQVGMPVGVHLDARSLDANPRLLTDAATLNMPVFVQAADGDSALAAALLRAQQRSQRWPSGVVIDGSADAFCAMLE